MNKKILSILLVAFIFAIPDFLYANGLQFSTPQNKTSFEKPKTENDLKKILKYSLHFFDGGKIQITNSYPKLTHANHQIDFINDIARTNLRDLDSKDIFTLDFVLWKDLSKHFRVDIAVSLFSGALETSDKGFKNTLNINTRFRQRYDVLSLWSNFFYYPLTYNYKEHKPNRLIDPFLAAGLGYTILRSETAIKFRRKNSYDRVINNYNDKAVGYKLMVGFDLNLGRLSKGLERYGLTFTVSHIWNRMKGHANTHLTKDLKIRNRNIDVDLRHKERMDIDLSGMCYSLALSYKF